MPQWVVWAVLGGTFFIFFIGAGVFRQQKAAEESRGDNGAGSLCHACRKSVCIFYRRIPAGEHAKPLRCFYWRNTGCYAHACTEYVFLAFPACQFFQGGFGKVGVFGQYCNHNIINPVRVFMKISFYNPGLRAVRYIQVKMEQIHVSARYVAADVIAVFQLFDVHGIFLFCPLPVKKHKRRADRLIPHGGRKLVFQLGCNHPAACRNGKKGWVLWRRRYIFVFFQAAPGFNAFKIIGKPGFL